MKSKAFFMSRDTKPDTSDLFRVVSQEFVMCANAVCSVAGVILSKPRLKCINSHFNECAHAFLEALIKRTEVIFVHN